MASTIKAKKCSSLVPPQVFILSRPFSNFLVWYFRVDHVSSIRCLHSLILKKSSSSPREEDFNACLSKGPTWNSNPNLNQNQDISNPNCIKVGVKIQNVHCMYFESKVIVTMMTSSKLKNANIWCSKRDRPWNIRLKNY